MTFAPNSPRRQFSLRTMIIVCMATGLLLGIGGPLLWRAIRKGEESAATPIVTAQTIQSQSELDAALRHRMVVLHFDVDWSMQAVFYSRPSVLRLRETLERDPKLKVVVFRRVDCTRKEGEVCDAVREWLKSHGGDTSVMHVGNGSVVWILDGKVVDSVDFPGGEADQALLARTRKAFGVVP